MADISLRPGQILGVNAILKDAGGQVITGDTLTWASDNTGVATVVQTPGNTYNGQRAVITAVAVGTANITATNQNSVVGTYQVSVVAATTSTITITGG